MEQIIHLLAILKVRNLWVHHSGKLGSSEGMHAELQQHTVLLRELVGLGHGTDNTSTGNPQSKEFVGPPQPAGG